MICQWDDDLTFASLCFRICLALIEESFEVILVCDGRICDLVGGHRQGAAELGTTGPFDFWFFITVSLIPNATLFNQHLRESSILAMSLPDFVSCCKTAQMASINPTCHVHRDEWQPATIYRLIYQRILQDKWISNTMHFFRDAIYQDLFNKFASSCRPWTDQAPQHQSAWVNQLQQYPA